MPLDDLLNGADLAEMVIGGWRYVFSRDYRLKKRREWREAGWVVKSFEFVFGLAGIILSVGFLVLIAIWLWGKF
jgi:hypothetical protein